jgi:hypothetical protein
MKNETYEHPTHPSSTVAITAALRRTVSTKMPFGQLIILSGRQIEETDLCHCVPEDRHWLHFVIDRERRAIAPDIVNTEDAAEWNRSSTVG